MKRNFVRWTYRAYAGRIRFLFQILLQKASAIGMAGQEGF